MTIYLIWSFLGLVRLFHEEPASVDKPLPLFLPILALIVILFISIAVYSYFKATQSQGSNPAEETRQDIPRKAIQ
jgi:hypothetical protein